MSDAVHEEPTADPEEGAAIIDPAVRDTSLAEKLRWLAGQSVIVESPGARHVLAYLVRDAETLEADLAAFTVHTSRGGTNELRCDREPADHGPDQVNRTSLAGMWDGSMPLPRIVGLAREHNRLHHTGQAAPATEENP
jgi:hypothetical protein